MSPTRRLGMIQGLPGWPPKEFQCTDDPTLPFEVVNNRGLVIESVTYVPGHPTANTAGDIVLTLVDNANTERCTARLKIKDSDLARRAQSALAKCKGLTLAEAGLRKIT